MFIIGLIIGIILTLIIISVRAYLKANHLKMKWGNVILALIIVWLIYSFLGMTFAPEYTKPNGNVCKGYKYGLKICSGDINAE